jgi:hypothetical protein
VNPANPLEQLRDLHLPGAVAWWPPAPGWWLTALIIIALIGAAVAWSLHRWRRGAYRRTGAALVSACFERCCQDQDLRAYLQAVNAVLKRVALSSFPSRDIAALSGARWTEFLDAQWRKEEQPGFVGGPLESGPYSDEVSSCDANAVRELALAWLRQHRGER